MLTEKSRTLNIAISGILEGGTHGSGSGLAGRRQGSANGFRPPESSSRNRRSADHLACAQFGVAVETGSNRHRRRPWRGKSAGKIVGVRHRRRPGNSGRATGNGPRGNGRDAGSRRFRRRYHDPLRRYAVHQAEHSEETRAGSPRRSRAGVSRLQSSGSFRIRAHRAGRSGTSAQSCRIEKRE